MPLANIAEQNVSVCIWNVGGLLSKNNNKLEDDDFIKAINQYD